MNSLYFSNKWKIVARCFLVTLGLLPLPVLSLLIYLSFVIKAFAFIQKNSSIKKRGVCVLYSFSKFSCSPDSWNSFRTIMIFDSMKDSCSLIPVWFILILGVF